MANNICVILGYQVPEHYLAQRGHSCRMDMLFLRCCQLDLIFTHLIAGGPLNEIAQLNSLLVESSLQV
ncbi:hypothetical protein E2562_020745 [Oryza meyeriana var. granulata]|uniref:Uncharacterized protein n=1 Tax=Oryza meyeriana var. granulata TaxID=110450 RepID=A0A6G1CGC0_9ORYZ|nr:hypothetical protein E2562_020745 [Oryza meyeriana var. granulata]